jgi:hypothetical protein
VTLPDSNPSRWQYDAGYVRWLESEVAHLRAALVAHHDMATLSEDVLREYDYRECPVCRRARGE